MLRIVLAEDFPADEARIREHAERFFRERGKRVELVCFHDGSFLDEAASHLEKQAISSKANSILSADCYLLDIEMPGNDGLTVAARIREHDRDVPICFISNLGWLAPEGYVVDAMGFLVKPVAYGQFCRLMRRVLARLEYRRSRLISVRVGKIERLVDAHHLVYAESFKKHSLLHLLDEDIACTESLRALEEKCIGASMFRVHNAILINLEYVEGVTAIDVIVQGKRLPLSRHRRQGLLGALAAFVGGDAVGGHSVAGRVPANGLTAGGDA